MIISSLFGIDIMHYAKLQWGLNDKVRPSQYVPSGLKHRKVEKSIPVGPIKMD